MHFMLSFKRALTSRHCQARFFFFFFFLEHLHPAASDQSTDSSDMTAATEIPNLLVRDEGGRLGAESPCCRCYSIGKAATTTASRS